MWWFKVEESKEIRGGSERPGRPLRLLYTVYFSSSDDAEVEKTPGQ